MLYLNNMLYFNNIKQSTNSVLCITTQINQNANNNECLLNHVTQKQVMHSVLINLSIVQFLLFETS